MVSLVGFFTLRVKFLSIPVGLAFGFLTAFESLSLGRFAPSMPSFPDHPTFNPTLTPSQMFRRGIFGGTYFRPIHSAVTGKNYSNQHLEFPRTWFVNPSKTVTSSKKDLKVNAYGVWSGQTLDYWEDHQWIKAQDPYGWVQWYCRFYQGRRSVDDERQIKRWINIAGPKGRWRVRLENLRNQGKDSPVIRQLLLQWAFDPK